MNDQTDKQAAKPATEQVREPARAGDRTEAVATERRRRKTGVDGDGQRQRMVIPEALLDHAKFVYRWANDDRTRIHQLTVEDDWEVMTEDGKTGTTGDNTALRYQVGTKPDGAPLYAFALRKKKTFADQDREEKIKGINAREKARLSDVPGDAPDKSYSPKS